MDKREVVRMVFAGEKPPYVPCSFSFTQPAHKKLLSYYGSQEKVSAVLDNHFGWGGGSSSSYFTALPNERVQDPFGVIWNKTVDKDIGVVEGQVVPEADTALIKLPSPDDPKFWDNKSPKEFQPSREGFRIFNIGFSLYERAWTMRGGIEQFMIDMIEEPEFAETLINAIADFNISLVERAVQNDIDAVYFGDDWGDQRGLQMGIERWRSLIKPALKRMYGAVHAAGKYVYIHSCGKVDSVFDDLVEIGLNCFNPFQPEVMDVHALMDKYRGRLSFHGGLSVQKTLPHGTAAEVRAETQRLMEHGSQGGFILASSHSVPGDVPIENMIAFIEEYRKLVGRG
jgi:uroporphyrinogen decarboxylase